MHTSTKTDLSLDSHIAFPLARTLACLIIATSAVLFATQMAHAADDANCAAMRKAQTTMMETSFRETVTTGSHPPRQIVVTPTKMYMQTPDGWISAAANAATRARFTHMLGNSLTDCRLLRSENVDGQTADVYSVTSRGASGKDSVITIWLSRSNHLPIRSESDVHSMFGGKQHVSIRLDYDNVHAPSGATQEIDMNRLFGGH